MLDETINHREPKAGTLALRLGGEERLESLLDDIGGHARTGIGDREHDILTGHDLGMRPAVGIVEKGIADLDSQLAGAVHRISGVDRKVEQRILDLDRIGKRIPETAGDDGLDLDFFAERAAQHVVHAGDEAAYIDDFRLQRLAAAEGEKLARQPRSAIDSGQRIGDTLLGAGIAGDILAEQLQIS